jgi:hypothetical protein
MMPKPLYTIVPYVEGRSYQRAEIVFDPATGECFQAVGSTSQAPGTSLWRWVPFLEKWGTFVVHGGFADCLGEFDQGGNDDLQAKLALASAAENRAQEALQNQIDALRAQGQKLQWNFCRRSCYWYESLPWVGGTVSTLTAECEDELGWVFPSPTPPPAQQGLFYFPEVLSLKTTAPKLTVFVATKNLSINTIAKINTGEEFRLDVGAANDADPGQGAPADYDLATNNKHWTQIV